MSDIPTKKPMPPYLPYATFRGFVETLHQNALPHVIDKSLMRNLSGGVQSHLMVALRFLGLIGPKGETVDKLQKLCAAFGKPGEWQTELKLVVESAYSSIIGTHDIARLSDKQLEDAFKAGAAVEGSMLARATRFYLQALTDAKVTISPYLLNRKKRQAGKRQGPKLPKSVQAASNGEERATTPTAPVATGGGSEAPKANEAPAGTIPFPLYFKGKSQGAIYVPETLNDEDVKLIELTVSVIKAYAASKAAS